MKHEEEHKKSPLKAFGLLSTLPRMKHSSALIVLGNLELMKSTVAGSTDSARGHLLLPTCADMPRRKAGFSKVLSIPLGESLHG